MMAAACSAGARSDESDPPRHDAHDLTNRAGLAQIELEGQVYTLRITRQRKLILTK